MKSHAWWSDESKNIYFYGANKNAWIERPHNAPLEGKRYQQPATAAGNDEDAQNGNSSADELAGSQDEAE